jgi:hypothetical protein
MPACCFDGSLHVALSVSGTGAPQLLLFSLPFSDRPIVLLVRDVVDISVPIRPHASFPESPIFLLCIVLHASRLPRVCQGRLSSSSYFLFTFPHVRLLPSQTFDLNLYDSFNLRYTLRCIKRSGMLLSRIAELPPSSNSLSCNSLQCVIC